MREIIRRALRTPASGDPIVPGPSPLIKLAALASGVLPQPPLTPDGVPATVDNDPLLKAMPRQLTSLEEGLAGYLGPSRATGAAIEVSPAT